MSVYKSGRCAACNSPAIVLRVWGTPRGVMRRKACESCGLKFQTIETVLGGPQMAENAICADLILDALESAGIEIVRNDLEFIINRKPRE